MRTLRVLLATVGITLAVAACEPTGHPRCDAELAPWGEIDAAGWDLDCTPGFPNIAGSGPTAGQRITGWADHSRRIVWVWPDAHPTRATLRKTLWHELAHVYGIRDEVDAERYAWCREPLDGVGYRLPSFPTAADCRRLGA